MKLIIIFCSVLMAQSYCQEEERYNNTIAYAEDSTRQSVINEVPYIEVNVEYNLITLDQIVLENSEDELRKEVTRVTYPVGAIITLDKKGVGIETMFIKIDKAQERLYTRPLKLSQKGFRTLLIRGLDAQGDEIIVQSLPINIISQ